MIAPVDTAAEQHLVRVGKVGYAATGLLHVLIGAIAIRLGTGTGGGSTADQSGALGQVAAQPLGRVALWAAVVVLVALAAWQLLQAVEAWREDRRAPGSDESGRDAGEAGKSVAKAVVNLAIALTASTYARGGSTSGEQQSTDVTASLLQSGPGVAVVVAIGAVLLGVGGYHVFSGITKRFTRRLQGLPAGRAGRVTVALGRVGYVAKGVALAVLGALFVLAAVQRDAQEAGGLDSALRTLGEQPFGAVLLVAVGLGFIAFGLYSVARARYARS
jgi:hypothetical protein